MTETADRGPAMIRIALSAALAGTIAGWWYVGPRRLPWPDPRRANSRLSAACRPRWPHDSACPVVRGRFHFRRNGGVVVHVAAVRPPLVFFVPLVGVLVRGVRQIRPALRPHRPGFIQWLPLWWLVLTWGLRYTSSCTSRSLAAGGALAATAAPPRGSTAACSRSVSECLLPGTD